MEFISEHQYAIIDRITDRLLIYKLLYDCVLDAYNEFKVQTEGLNLSYIDTGRMKLRDFDEECISFEMDRY